MTVQRRRAGSRRWTTVKVLSTNGSGFWTLRQTVTGTADYRFRWQPTDQYDAPTGPMRTSDVLRVRLKRTR